MRARETKELFVFGSFRLDVGQRLLFRGTESAPLPPKALDTLLVLVENHGRIVEKDHLLRTVWPDTFVEESGLARNISLLRKVLGESPDDQRFIQTIPRRGYRFVASVQTVSAVETTPIEVNPPAQGNGIRPSSQPVEPEATARTPNHRTRRLHGIAIAALTVFAVSALVGTAWKMKSSAVPALIPAHLSITLPADQRLVDFDIPGLAFSPDGRSVAYVAERNGTQQIFLRALNESEARRIPGTERSIFPFFSPDGQWLGFFANGSLRKVAVAGGSSIVLAPGTAFRGATWGSNGQIIYSPSTASGLFRVPASGGIPQAITFPDPKIGEVSHRYPQYLPGYEAILFTINRAGSSDDVQIVVQRLDSGRREVLVQGGSDGRYVSSGHLVYARNGTLMAAPFDVNRLKITGPAVAVLEHLAQSINLSGSAPVSVSNLGWLVYTSGNGSPNERKLAWVDRKGNERPLSISPAAFGYPRISPDGKRVAVDIDQGTRWQTWIYNISGGTLARLTFEGDATSPVWTPDGKRVAFGFSRPRSLYWKLADGSGTEEQLTSSNYPQRPMSWSPDGRMLAFQQTDPATASDIWVLSLNDQKKAQPFLRTPFGELAPAFSPDGHWLAYVSNESGEYEIYVQAFPANGGKWQISSGGGQEPVWERNGRELFYRSLDGDQIMAVDVATGTTFNAGKPHRLFAGHYWNNFAVPAYDVSPDGQTFLMVKESDSTVDATQINVVANWGEDLKLRVPVR